MISAGYYYVLLGNMVIKRFREIFHPKRPFIGK